MIKVAVVGSSNLKRYSRFTIFSIITLLILFILYNYSKIDLHTFSKNSYLSSLYYKCLDSNIPQIKLSNKKDSNSKQMSFIQYLLYSELPLIKNDNLFSDPSYTENNNILEEVKEDNLTYASTDVKTEPIENNVPTTYTDNFYNVEIKNSTDYQLTEDILNPNDLQLSNNIIIFHTHTCESYTPTDSHPYEATGNFRTTNLDFSVVKVGNILTDYLSSYGYKVFHDSTYHDYPSYTGSYGRSQITVENILQSNPNSDIIIDIHRDAIGDTSYAPSVKIGDDVVAQLMFVIGTDGGGLEHPNWQENLKFAVKVQEKANELYPGLFKPIVLRNSRYNQQLGKAACIIEVGATGNTLEQSMLSMKYLSKVLDEILKQEQSGRF